MLIYADVANYTSCGSRGAGSSSGKGHVIIHQDKRTVATLLTASKNKPAPSVGVTTNLYFWGTPLDALVVCSGAFSKINSILPRRVKCEQSQIAFLQSIIRIIPLEKSYKTPFTVSLFGI